MRTTTSNSKRALCLASRDQFPLSSVTNNNNGNSNSNSLNNDSHDGYENDCQQTKSKQTKPLVNYSLSLPSLTNYAHTQKKLTK